MQDFCYLTSLDYLKVVLQFSSEESVTNVLASKLDVTAGEICLHSFKILIFVQTFVRLVFVLMLAVKFFQLFFLLLLINLRVDARIILYMMKSLYNLVVQNFPNAQFLVYIAYWIAFFHQETFFCWPVVLQQGIIVGCI